MFCFVECCLLFITLQQAFLFVNTSISVRIASDLFNQRIKRYKDKKIHLSLDTKIHSLPLCIFRYKDKKIERYKDTLINVDLTTFSLNILYKKNRVNLLNIKKDTFTLLHFVRARVIINSRIKR